jgi:hypothetical protein
MENKKIAKIFILIIVLITFLVLAMLISSRIKSGKVVDNKSILSAEPGILETYPLAMKYVKVFAADKDGKKTEVTGSVVWTSNNPEEVSVSNENPIKGQIVAQKKGDYSIKAQYNGSEVNVPVKVATAEMKISCKAIPPEAKVGQTVTWIMFFDKMGTPRYEYSMTGSDGLDTKDSVSYIKYKTPGEKTVKMKAIDYAGTEAEVTCPPYIVSAK